jgi:hypothetical protein
MAKRTRSERYAASDEITRDLVDRKEHDVINYLSRAAVDYLSAVDDRLRFYYKGPERIKTWSETAMLEVVPDRYHDLIVELAARYMVVEKRQPSPRAPVQLRKPGKLARLALCELYKPDGLPPDHIDNPEIVQDVCASLKVKGVKETEMPSRNTVLRAAGRLQKS